MAISTGSQPGILVNDEVSSRSYFYPFIFVTCLFFLWGFSYGLLDVLNKHFQQTMQVSIGRSTLLQMSYFGAYFIMGIPAGLFMSRFGYKRGIITGLLLFATGAFLLYLFAGLALPNDSKFNCFLGSFLVLASGLTFLETAANPYSTILGKPEGSAFRLNLSQSFNGVGAFLGPLVGGYLFFSSGSHAINSLASVQFVYIIIAIVVFLFALLFWFIRLPEIKESRLVSDVQQDIKPLFAHRHFVISIIAQFLYVGAQVGIAALFINYCTKADGSLSDKSAATLLSISLILFTIGRFTGSALMQKIAPNKLLMIYAIVNVLLCIVVVSLQSTLSIYALMIVFFFESIMFPTIFALGVKDLGHHTKRGSSFLVMSVAGGAIMPFLMGRLSDMTGSTANGFLIPLLCFVFVAGMDGGDIRRIEEGTAEFEEEYKIHFYGAIVPYSDVSSLASHTCTF